MMTGASRGNRRKSRGGRPSAEEAALISDRILDAAWSIAVDQGPEALSYDRLAEEAMAGKATLYARFPNKIVLGRAMLERRISLLEQDFEADLPKGRSFEAELASLAERVSGLMSAPAGRTVERFVDWLTLADADSGQQARSWLYGRSTRLIAGRLTSLAERWGEKWSDPEMGARFWLESVFGHARMSESGETLADWPARHARAFARAFASSSED